MSKKGGQKKKVAYIAEMRPDEEDAIKLVSVKNRKKKARVLQSESFSCGVCTNVFFLQDLFPSEDQNHNLGAYPGIGGGRSAGRTKQYDDEAAYGYGDDATPNRFMCVSGDEIHPHIYTVASVKNPADAACGLSTLQFLMRISSN
jgi:hypothetical protein